MKRSLALGTLLLFSSLACAEKPAAKELDLAEGAKQVTDPRVTRADLSRIMGSESAPVWILVMSDFQCPYCKAFHDDTWSALTKEFVDSGKARLAFINFPLRMHANARPASEAAMCAGAQDKFWEYQSALFTKADEWTPLPDPEPVFATIAKDLALNETLFTQCMANDVMLAMVQGDYNRGVQLGVNSTPSFMVGDQLVEGNAPLSSFIAAYERATAAK